MKSLLIFFAFLFSINSVSSFAKSREGDYYIRGKLLDRKSKKALLNSNFIVNNKIYFTDSLGNFELIIHWIAYEKNNATKSKNSNPKWIEIKYNNRKARIKNNWKKYAKGYYADKKSTTLKKDIFI